MKNRELLLLVEAIALSAPITFVALGGVPILLVSSLSPSTLRADPLSAILGLLFVAGILLALQQFWVLAFRTAGEELYYFGFRFWLAVVGAASAIYPTISGGFFELKQSLAIVCPIVFAASHFIFLQLRSIRH
jgi:hypothetical protein